MVEIAQVCRDRRDAAGVLAALEAAAKAAPTNLDVRTALAWEYGEQNRADEALRAFKEILAANPNHVAALMRLGQLHRSRGNWQKSKDAFGAVLELQPNHTQALVELARVTWAAGEPFPAQRLLACALSKEPNHLGAIIASAELALLAGDTRAAVQSALRAIELHPQQVGPYLLGARAAASLLDRHEALRLLNQARAAFGFRPEILAAQIHIFRHYRDYEAARAVIEEGDVPANANFGFWMQATSFAVAQGEFEIAERALNSAPALSTREMARAHFLRASIAEAHRQYPEAIAGYEAAIALDGSEAEYHETVARCYLLVADSDRAREHLRVAINIAKGKSSNISQHHLGQMLDEFVLDRDVLDELQRVRALSASARIEALHCLVREHPNQTAPAVLLLLAMRQGGLFAAKHRELCPGTDLNIPKRIVHYWHGPTPPPDVSEIIATWWQMHPDYEDVLLDDAAAVNFLQANSSEGALHAFRRGSTPGQRADILRLAYLCSLGGFFIDADDRCLARIDTFVPASAEFAGYQENYGTIGVNFLGATPGHPVITLALKNAIAAVNRGDRDIAWLSSGSGLLTRAFAQWASAAVIGDPYAGTSLLELWEFQRVVGVHCPARYKCSNRR